MAVICAECGEKNSDEALTCGMCGIVLRKIGSNVAPGLPAGRPAAPMPGAAQMPGPAPRQGVGAATNIPLPRALPNARPLPPPPASLRRPATAFPQASMEYAGIFTRFVAMVIDNVILILILSAVGGIAFASHQMALIGGIYPLAIIVAWLYFALQESGDKQATFGKSLMGIMVTDVDGFPISFGRASARFFSKMFLSGLFFSIGYLIAFFTPKKQSLHDMIAGTIVV